MTDSSPESDILLRQYAITREEIQKSIFVQYDVIKIGTTFLSTLLVGVPTAYAYLRLNNVFFLSLTLLVLAFVSMSFVFIMGAGEIRIMRAAAFSNALITDLLERYQPYASKDLIWDHFVARWNDILNKNHKHPTYVERLYLAMPFVIIAILADVGAAAAPVLWYRTNSFSTDEMLLSVIVFLSLVVQLWLYFWPSRLSRELERTTKEIAETPHPLTDASLDATK